MSTARELKQREWSSNIFNTSATDTPLFARKRRSSQDNHLSRSFNLERSNSRDSFYSNKRNEGSLFLFPSQKQGLNPVKKREKIFRETESMRSVLQPFADI